MSKIQRKGSLDPYRKLEKLACPVAGREGLELILSRRTCLSLEKSMMAISGDFESGAHTTATVCCTLLSLDFSRLGRVY